MSDQTLQVDRWLLSEPGGPAGPFWGIVTQSGRVIALQIVECQHAEILQIMWNIVSGDEDTIKELSSHLTFVFDETLGPEMLPEKPDDYFIKAVMDAILLQSIRI